jgi:hypothetical protein
VHCDTNLFPGLFGFFRRFFLVEFGGAQIFFDDLSPGSVDFISRKLITGYVPKESISGKE